MGRAGRAGFDDRGVAVIMCTDDKRDFYHKVRNDKRQIIGPSSVTISYSCLMFSSCMSLFLWSRG